MIDLHWNRKQRTGYEEAFLYLVHDDIIYESTIPNLLIQL